MSRMRGSAPVFAALLLSGGCAHPPAGTESGCFDRRPPEVVYRTHSSDAVFAVLGSAPRENAARAARLRSLFASVGCAGDRLREQTVGRSQVPNLVCTLPGSGPGAIVVGAHLDKVEKGDGVVDNWSGAALLPFLYANLAAAPRSHTFVIAAFSEEEKGLAGSRAFVHSLERDELAAIRAMVNLDSIGLGPTKVEVSRSDPDLVCNLLMAGSATGQRIGGVNADGVGTSDWEPFKQAGIPVISIHSITKATLPILHTPADTLEAIDRVQHYETYRLVSAYLALLDVMLEK